MVDYVASIDKLFLDEMVKNQIIPFIGAGLSRNAIVLKNEAMPDWEELGKKFSKLLDNDKVYSSPTEAISEYEKSTGRNLLIAKLYEFLNIDNTIPGSAHKAFIQFPYKTIITTNFDNLIEKSFDDDIKYHKIYDSKDYLSRHTDKVDLIKLHGDFDRQDSIVITYFDYEKVEQNSLYRNDIRHLIITNSVFYICYSYNDPDLQKVIKELNNDLKPRGVNMFGLLINPKKADLDHFQEHKIIPIILHDPNRSRRDILSDFFNQINLYVKNELEKHVNHSKEVIEIHKYPKQFVRKDSLLVGRKTEMTQLTRLVRENKFVSVIGEGGVGKTALVFQVLENLQDYTLVSIKIDKPTYSDILSQFYSALRLIDNSEGGIKQKLKQMNKVIVLLDDFELVSNLLDSNDTADLKNIYQFLQSFPTNVTIVLASRNRKNISGEVSLNLQGLQLEDGIELFSRLTKNVQIKSSPDLETKLAKIISDIRGLPLGIKLIAGAYQGGGITELESIFNNIIKVSAYGEDERHVSIKDCYADSYHRLSRSQQELLRYLVLLRSPFNKRMFENVFSSYEYPDLLRLFNRNWLFPIQIGESEEDIYFDFHPFIRSYLEELPRIEETKEKLFQIRYSKYYFEFLNEIYDNRKNPKEYAKYTRVVDLLLQKRITDMDLILDLAISLEFRSFFANIFALVLLEFHYLTRALEVNSRCIQFDEELNDSFRIGNDHSIFSTIYANLEKYDKAISESIDAIKYYQRGNHFQDIARVYLEMVSHYLKNDNITSAEEMFNEFRKLFGNNPVQFHDYRGYLNYKNAEFYLEFKKDNLKEASAIIDQVIDKYLKGEIPKRDIASFYQDKGLTLKLEDYERAYESFLQAFYIYEEYEDIPKQLQITELVLKLFQIWEQNNDLPDWEKRKIRLEKLMKEKNLQFAQHEML